MLGGEIVYFRESYKNGSVDGTSVGELFVDPLRLALLVVSLADFLKLPGNAARDIIECCG